MKKSEEEIWCYCALIYHDEQSGNNVVAFQTEWAGFADKESRIELRRPRKDTLSWLDVCHHHWDIGALQYISTQLEFYRYWIVGGLAAVNSDLAETLIPERLESEPTTSTGFGPFDRLKSTITSATQRAPSRKLRMKILERDKFKCVICGQRPSDDTNIVLNVHHIRPWENFGATVPTNLVTLCHSCHMGLDPHYNQKLAELVDDRETRWASYRTKPQHYD